jgi:hypothetical protein
MNHRKVSERKIDDKRGNNHFSPVTKSVLLLKFPSLISALISDIEDISLVIMMIYVELITNQRVHNAKNLTVKRRRHRGKYK